MATTTDLSKLEHMYVNAPLHFYYDTNAAGKRVLRHIRVNWHEFEVPADGVTVEIPEGSVGSKQIEDESIEMDDLSPSVKEELTPAERVTQDELDNFNA